MMEPCTLAQCQGDAHCPNFFNCHRPPRDQWAEKERKIMSALTAFSDLRTQKAIYMHTEEVYGSRYMALTQEERQEYFSRRKGYEEALSGKERAILHQPIQPV